LEGSKYGNPRFNLKVIGLSATKCNDIKRKLSQEDIIENQHDLLYHHFVKFPFPQMRNLDDFTLAVGGQPYRSIIMSTWRSGSKFLGDTLNAFSGNFYHCEPLQHYGIKQIRGPPWDENAIDDLKHLLKCNYTTMTRYIEFSKLHDYVFSRNIRLWNVCAEHPEYCWNATFLSEFCKIFPYQSMKIVRLRVKIAEELLKDNSLNTKILYMVRDPRSTFEARKGLEWCKGVPDCKNVSMLCQDMLSDYAASVDLKKKYPNRFRVIRYENLALRPVKMVERIFQFFGMVYDADVKKFVEVHTTNKSNSSSYVFDKTAPFHWRIKLTFSEIQDIQGKCREAMKSWGYTEATNASTMYRFNPLTTYQLDDFK
ncbi:hypothetical protein AMK59_7933, partial [Oryctes borbonicus]